MWGAILQSQEEQSLVLKCQDKECAMKKVKQTMFLQSLQPLLAYLKEVLDLCLVNISPSNHY